MGDATPSSALSSVVNQQVSSAMSNSIPVITQSATKIWPHNVSNHLQQLTPIHTTTDAATNLSVFTDFSKIPENYVFEHFKFSCEITARSDAEEEWDYLDDFRPLTRLPPEIALETGKDEEISDDDEEWEVLNDLKFLIPLPSEIALKTGKYEEVLFEDQVKLYKLVDKEWKEQNLCIVKILHNSFNERVRLIMSREEVLKACANHYITSDMEIHPLRNFDQAWTWVAPEFVNEVLEPKHLCIRFKNPELAAAFKAAFIKAVDIAKGLMANNLSSSKFASTDCHVKSKQSRLKFVSTALPWCCPLCETNNLGDKHFCVICETLKPFRCNFCEGNIGAVKCSCSRECDIFSNLPMLSDTSVAESLATNNVSSSKAPKTDSNVISKSCGLKHASIEASCCRPLCETDDRADKRLGVICEMTKPFCCSECNIYAMLSDDDISSDGESDNN